MSEFRQILGFQSHREKLQDLSITQGYVYYAHSHQRQSIPITSELREDAIATIQAVRTLLTTGTMPLPVYTKRCRGCSLYRQCLPQASKKVSRYRESA